MLSRRALLGGAFVGLALGACKRSSSTTTPTSPRRTIHEGVECPSLSPDNRLIAFKKKVGGNFLPLALLRAGAGDDEGMGHPGGELG